MFLLVSGRHVGAHPDGHQHGVSIQISINLGKKLLPISYIGRVLPEKWVLGVGPTYQIPYSIYDQNLRFSLPYL